MKQRLFLAFFVFSFLPLIGGYPSRLNDKNFSEQIHKGKIVVEFYSDKCPACRKYTPIFDSVAQGAESDIKFGKLNTRKENSSADSQKISQLPTTVVYDNGKEVKRKSGKMSPSELKEFIR